MSQTELDVSHGYAFSQVANNGELQCNVCLINNRKGGKGSSFANRIYSKIRYDHEVISFCASNQLLSRLITTIFTLANQAELLKDRDASSVGVNLNIIRRQGIEVIVAYFYVL